MSKIIFDYFQLYDFIKFLIYKLSFIWNFNVVKSIGNVVFCFPYGVYVSV